MTDVRITKLLPANTFKLPIFATPEFLRLKAVKNNFGYFYNDKFALPFFINRYFFIKRLKFTESVIAIEGEEENVHAQKIFLDDVIRLISSEKIADFIDPAMAHCLFKIVPENSEFIEWGSYILNFETIKTGDDILNNFPKNFRNQIRKAIKDGVTVCETDDLKTVHRLINETFKRQKSPYSPSYNFLTKIKNEMPDSSKFYLAKKESEALGALVLLFNEQGATGLFSGSGIRTYNCMNLIHFEVINDLIKLNIKKHNLGGARLIYRKNSKFAGIQLFKEGMGAELERGYMFTYDRSKIKKKIFYKLVSMYLFLTGKKYEGDVVQQVKKLKKEYKSSQKQDIVILYNIVSLCFSFDYLYLLLL